MKLEAITSLFSDKNKKAALDAANKIEELTCKLSGMQVEKENRPKELKELLENAYQRLEKLDKKLEAENKRKMKEPGKGSGFVTAQISLSGNMRTYPEENISMDKGEVSAVTNVWQVSALHTGLMEIRDRVMLIKKENSDIKSENIDFLYDELGKLLEKEGVRAIELSGAFNAENQVIVGIEAADKEEMDNTIYRTVRPGYVYHQQLVRPQEVIVYSYKK